MTYIELNPRVGDPSENPAETHETCGNFSCADDGEKPVGILPELVVL